MHHTLYYTDACDTCIGACLTQLSDNEEKPIYYLSHKLSTSQCSWSTVEKEAFAIHFKLQKLDYYMHNAEFIIKIDHKPLKFLLESPMQNRKYSYGHLVWQCLTVGLYIYKVPQIPVQIYCLDTQIKVRDEHDVSLDVNDNSYQVNVLDSTNFDPKAYASCELPQEDSLQKPETLDLKDFDMYKEQSKDDDLMTLRSEGDNGGDPGRNKQTLSYSRQITLLNTQHI